MIRKPECDDFTLWLFLLAELVCIETLLGSLVLFFSATAQNAVFCEARRGAGCAKHLVLWALQRAGGERPRADSTPRRMRRTVATVRRKAH